jgi:hypothetical protein
MFLVKQPVLAGIDDSEIKHAATADGGIYEVIEVDTRQSALAAMETGEWARAGAEVVRVFRERVQPRMNDKPDALLAYFGTAPIPLAMLLGHLVGSWAKVEPYIRHHKRKDWVWAEPPPEEARVKLTSSSQERQPIAGDAILRVSTSFPVDPAHSRAVVAEPIIEVDVALDPTGLDAITSPRLLAALADSFLDGLTQIMDLRPRVGTVHVFASVPVGLALLMGTRVTATYHPRIQTYYFSRSADPPNIRAIVLQEAEGATPSVRLESEEVLAAERARAQEEVRKLATLASSCEEEGSRPEKLTWLTIVLRNDKREGFFQGAWRALPRIFETPIKEMRLDPIRDAGAGFRYDERQAVWLLGSGFLSGLYRRVPDGDARYRAIRMLFLHEGVHAAHRLTRTVSPQIGRFPKLVEEVDYQADVWGMLHEFKRTRSENHEMAKDVRGFFLDLIETALETFWVFDDGPMPLERIEVRRLNRYLIWFWQFLRIEGSRDQDEVFNILASKPLLEIAGPRQSVREHDVFFELESRPSGVLELGVLHENVIRRLTPGPAFHLDGLLAGFKNRNGEQVRECLRGAYAQVRS